MGSILSRNSSRTRALKPFEVSHNETCKRQRLSSGFSEENPRLIPSLPDEISLQILARLPRIYYLNVKLVSRAWKTAVTSSELFNLRKELGTTEEWLYILMKVEDDKFSWCALDPLLRRWQRLPPMPIVIFEDESKRGSAVIRMWNVLGSSVKVADVIRSWLGRKDPSNQMSFCGCAIGAVDGCLYVLGGFSRALAMRNVWRYDPVKNSWSEVSPMSIGRAYCKTGILNNKLYIVGGVIKGPGGLTPLQSAEVFDPRTSSWSEIPSMPFSKAQVLPMAFLADLLKPIATGITSYRGRLFVPQSLYFWPFFVDVGGESYDPEVNSWVEMPVGMGEGWPVKQAGTKLSVTVEGELYALEPSASNGLDSARIKVYDYHNDAWKVVIGNVPLPDFTDSESPYLLAGLLGKLFVITNDANHNIAVLQADVQNHFASIPSASSSSLNEELVESVAQSETDIWKIISSRSVRSAELISCQTLDV